LGDAGKQPEDGSNDHHDHLQTDVIYLVMDCDLADVSAKQSQHRLSRAAMK
jgi:hypothetical protein